MQETIRIGVDLGKTYFQLHAVEREGAVGARRKLSRTKMRAFFARSRALPGRHGGLRLGALLGARACRHGT